MTESTAQATALSSLTSEHRLLSRLIDALSGYAARLEAEPSHGPADLLAFAELLAGFVDLGHHFKEEQIVLPELVRHGVAWQGDALERIEHDHEQSRYLVEVLTQAASQQDVWSSEDRRQIIATINTFVELERAHIAFENTYLLPALLERLGAEELSGLATRFDASDEHFGRQNYTRLTELAEVLIERYGSFR